MAKVNQYLLTICSCVLITLTMFAFGACVKAAPEEGMEVDGQSLLETTDDNLQENTLATTIPYKTPFDVTIYQTPGYTPTWLMLYSGSVLTPDPITMVWNGTFTNPGSYTVTASDAGWLAPGSTATTAIWGNGDVP